ncbi:hypothetical protein BDDG_02704 [Blastomyces dermatitidis ATCC 18188]|uniref:Zn(2)-C6 fungal-type domain-containing protein n=1 Tax=Ajellomyces dermatitidis (strain ATCC 18188 / CBS 674.68) TaxID=653446 RepID=F2T950_AJEDA|nr:hypothetical protein BDDG_02704 [Blastomyces dermatitidis ATCC 18188]
MTSVVAKQHSDAKGRKRKAHRKSRQGCGNCKIRRVKCDEGRPGCQKCASFGVSCSYEPGAADLQPSRASTFQSDGYGFLQFQNLSAPVPRKSPCSLNDTILSMINTSQAAAFSPRPRDYDSIHSAVPQRPYQLREHDLELLSIFQARTACSIGTDATLPIYRREFIRLACQHPFLLHMVLTMTLLHDRYLSHFPPWPRSSSPSQLHLTSSPKALFHWYLGTILFNTKLANPSQIDPRERDAIWAASVLLGAITFSFVDASRAEDSWPLKPSSHLDPNWLAISDGKREVWKLADPLRADSVFREALIGPVHGETDHSAPSTVIDGPGLNVDDGWRFCFACSSNYYSVISSVSASDTIYTRTPPHEFLLLHHFITTTFPDPDPKVNPYHTALTTLHSLFTTPFKPHTPIAPFIAFITHIDPAYRNLLHHKDPLALLLLAYWYGYVYENESEHAPWWFWSRAMVEGRAICMYLERNEAVLSNRNVIGRDVGGLVDELTMKQLISWPIPLRQYLCENKSEITFAKHYQANFLVRKTGQETLQNDKARQ